MTLVRSDIYFPADRTHICKLCADEANLFLCKFFQRDHKKAGVRLDSRQDTLPLFDNYRNSQ